MNIQTPKIEWCRSLRSLAQSTVSRLTVSTAILVLSIAILGNFATHSKTGLSNSAPHSSSPLPLQSPTPLPYLGPTGANILAAQALPYGLTGTEVSIGIIEHPTSPFSVGIQSPHSLGARLIGQWNFNGLVPPVYGPPPPPLPPAGCVPPPPITAGSSEHARLVADVAAGANTGVYSGVAPAANVLAAHIDQTTDFTAGHDTSRAGIAWVSQFGGALSSPPAPARIFNLSYGYPGNDNGVNQLAQFLDLFAFGSGSLVVATAANDSFLIRKPGDCYNCITVGATDESFQRRLDVSGYVLSPDGRSKPDILAPGKEISDGFTTSTGTSFAAPQVAGAAALLAQNGLPLSIFFQRAARAIILNSARKRFISHENMINGASKDNLATATEEKDYDYLDGAALRTGMTGSGPKTDHWTPAVWAKTATGPFVTIAPLDDEQGVGVLDVTRAVVQMNGPGLDGNRPPGLVPPIGWGFASVSGSPSSEQTKTYVLNFPVKAGSFITATLVWDRLMQENDPGNPNFEVCPPRPLPGQVDQGDTYSVADFSNADLRIVRQTPSGPVVIASSQSTVDNLEHLHIPAPADGDVGDYSIEVNFVSGSGVQFAIAWWASSSVVISEFRTRGPNGGNDEFIELYNTGNIPVDIGGWKIKSSTGAGSISTLLTINAGTMLPARGHFLATNSSAGGYSGSAPGDQTYATDVADNGGIALTLAENSIIDQAGMSTGLAFREGTALAPLSGIANQSYERKPGGASGSAQDTHNNANDFQLRTPSDPQNLSSPPALPADLSLTKTDSPDPVTAGQNLSYTITLTNNGPDAATAATVSDNLPASLTFVSCAATGGGVCGGTGANRTINFASLAASASATITLVARVNCSTPDGAVISNTATVSAATPDSNTGNNAATATSTVSNPPPMISPTSQSFQTSGGIGAVSVTFPSGCVWTAVSNDLWITITAGGSGTGNGTVSFTVALNTTGNPRSGTMTIAGLTFTVTQSGGLQYYPLPFPVRLLDTRPGESACFAPGVPLGNDAVRLQPATGTCLGATIPSSARSLVGNATVVNFISSGFHWITLYPSDAAQPNASNLNFTDNQIVPNNFTVGLGPDGAFKIYSHAATHFIVDITGYYAPPGTGGLYFHPLPAPVRLLDTRPGEAGCDAPGVPLANDGIRTVTAHRTCFGATIPSSARSVVGNATVVNFISTGFHWITLYPFGTPQPVASNLNFIADQIVPNWFVVGLSSDGKFNIYSHASTHFIVDVAGYFSDEAVDVNGAGLLYTALPTPVRLLDTRPGETGCDAPGVPLGNDATRIQTAHRTCFGVTIPSSAKAVVGNGTVVNFISTGFHWITLYPFGAAQPNASNLNFTENHIVPNAFWVGLGSDGKFNIYSHASTHFIVDLTGFFAP